MCQVVSAALYISLFCVCICFVCIHISLLLYIHVCSIYLYICLFTYNLRCKQWVKCNVVYAFYMRKLESKGSSHSEVILHGRSGFTEGQTRV